MGTILSFSPAPMNDVPLPMWTITIAMTVLMAVLLVMEWKKGIKGRILMLALLIDIYIALGALYLIQVNEVVWFFVMITIATIGMVAILIWVKRTFAFAKNNVEVNQADTKTNGSE